MMKDSSLKAEDPLTAAAPPSFLNHYSMTHDDDTGGFLGEVLEYSDLGDRNMYTSSSLGFMELLNMPDYFGPNSLFDVSVPSPSPSPSPSAQLHHQKPLDAAVQLNNTTTAPATPNSSSISSESNDERTKEAGAHHEHDDEEDEDEDDDDNKKTEKEVKPAAKKTAAASQKRKREPRFAFMTKSEVDHLEDGYRWRKYGQKAVKNSAFPRSYYRCTSASCNVKKRVERCWNDPSIVVTTYEGQHTHPSPMMQRSPAAAWQSAAFTSANPPNSSPQMLLSHQHPPQGFSLFNGNVGAGGARPLTSQHGQLILDNGLLQDMVPLSLIKKEKR